MKKIILFALIIILSLFLVYVFKNDKHSELVYIESYDSEYLKSGSGVVYKTIEGTHYILTLYHIVESSNDIFVTNIFGKRKQAQLLYFDDYKDIAILSVDDMKLNKVKKIKCDYSLNDKVSILGLSSEKISKKSGIIVGDNIEIDIPNIYGNSHYHAIKINSNIDFGDSGSAILDKNNNLIGLISVKDETTNQAYGIPICDALNVIALLEKNKINRPNLKSTIKNSMDISGIIVSQIHNSSFLINMGIKDNDVITGLNGVSIKNTSEFRNELFKLAIGNEICLDYYRDGNSYYTCGIISD